MHRGFTLLPALLLLVLQSSQEVLKTHFEAAEKYRSTGNPTAAELEYKAILAEGYLRLGKIYTAQKEFKRAVGVLESATGYAPESKEGLIELAIARFHSGQYKDALDPLGRVLERDPRNSAARNILGKTYFMLGEFAKSAAELEVAFKLAPADLEVAYTLGLAYLKQRQFDPAKRIYDGILKRSGERPQLRLVFGRAYRETAFLPEAIEEFKRAIALDPRLPRAHYYLGLTYLLKDGAARLSDAAKEFNIELSSNPDEFFANYYLGIIYAIERKWDLAIRLLAKASRRQPNNPDPYFHLGQAYQGLAKHEEAIDLLKKAIALNPDLAHNDYQVTTAHYRLGQSLLRVGRTAEGERELEIAADLKTKAFNRDSKQTGAFPGLANMPEEDSKLAELDSKAVAAPDSRTAQGLDSEAAFYGKIVASAHNDIGLLRADRQDFRAAAEQFELALKWNPQHKDVNYNLGLACFKAESYKQAIEPLETELKANPANIAVKQLLGLSYFAADNFAGASALLEEVISVRPNEVALYYPLAISLIKQGKTEPARRTIEQMVARGGDSPQLHILLGQAAYEGGDTAKALEELGAALALDRKARLAHFYAGVIHLKMGKFEEAEREFESELALDPNEVQAKYHLGFTLLARQETQRGIRILQEVIQLRPRYGDARYELGKALLQQGDARGAVENLEVAAAVDPEKPHVHYQLGRAYIAAGRQTEGESHLEISRRLNEKARSDSNKTTPQR